ncbi:hypothetical protein SLEP1_g59444, partial [Rubroshorea leprosula]
WDRSEAVGMGGHMVGLKG